MRKTYTTEFKAKVVIEILREEQTLSQISGKYEIHQNQLKRWKKQVIEGIPTILDDKRKKEAENTDKELIQGLYAEIGELTTKLNWLKKKSGIDIK